MKQVIARVISNIRVLPEYRRSDGRASLETRLIWLECPDIAASAIPGQFVMVRCGRECTLPRPFSIFSTHDGDLAIFYAVWEGGKGTEWLAERNAGDEVQLFGPLGNGFSIALSTENVLLVAGGIGIAPLYFLMQATVSRNLSTTLLYGTVSHNRYPVPPEVKLVPATEDGSVGYKGMVTDLIPQYIDEADQVFVCGSLAMYRAMSRNKSELKLEGKPVQVSLEVRMGCGAGVCYGCTIKTKQGLKQVCKDGPVFDLDDIIWESL